MLPRKYFWVFVSQDAYADTRGNSLFQAKHRQSPAGLLSQIFSSMVYRKSSYQTRVVEGIVLAQFPVREKSQKLQLLTPTLGAITVFAAISQRIPRGVHGEFVLKQEAGQVLPTFCLEWTLINDFRSMQQSADSLQGMQELLQLSVLLRSSAPSSEQFLSLLSHLNALNHLTSIAPWWLVASFALKSFFREGLLSDQLVFPCGYCDAVDSHLFIGQAGFLCFSHRFQEVQPCHIDREEKRFLQKLLCLRRYSDLLGLEAPPQLFQKVYRLIHVILKRH